MTRCAGGGREIVFVSETSLRLTSSNLNLLESPSGAVSFSAALRCRNPYESLHHLPLSEPPNIGAQCRRQEMADLLRGGNRFLRHGGLLRWRRDGGRGWNGISYLACALRSGREGSASSCLSLPDMANRSQIGAPVLDHVENDQFF